MKTLPHQLTQVSDVDDYEDEDDTFFANAYVLDQSVMAILDVKEEEDGSKLARAEWSEAGVVETYFDLDCFRLYADLVE